MYERFFKGKQLFVQTVDANSRPQRKLFRHKNWFAFCAHARWKVRNHCVRGFCLTSSMHGKQGDHFGKREGRGQSGNIPTDLETQVFQGQESWNDRAHQYSTTNSMSYMTFLVADDLLERAHKHEFTFVICVRMGHERRNNLYKSWIGLKKNYILSWGILHLIYQH